MSRVIVPDVRSEPWATDVTVIVDVASLTHTVAEDVLNWLGLPAKTRHRQWTQEFLDVRTALRRNLHRVVDVFEYHGVRPARLLLSIPSHPFPPAATGWRPTEEEMLRNPDQQRGAFLLELADTEKETRRRLDAEGRDDVEVQVLPAFFSADGEHCVDEQCVLAAAASSWDDPDRKVFVLSWDADVTVAPWLAGGGPILVARSMNNKEAAKLKYRLARHRPDHIPTGELPPSLRLTTESLRNLLVHPEDLSDASEELRGRLAKHRTTDMVTLSVEVRDGARRLVDPSQRDNEGQARTLTQDIDRPHPQRWFDLRRHGLLGTGEPCAAVVVVDSFGLMTTANRAGLPARVPSVTSVERALAPLGIDGRLGQVAVIPDILNKDHGQVALSRTIDGHELDTQLRKALSAPLRSGLTALDVDNQKAIDSYLDDEKPWTIPTTSVFASSHFDRIGRSPVVLEEKESAVLLAADIMWLLVNTDLPVIVLTDRADLMVALHLIEDHIGPDRRMRERIVRVGFHADTFRDEGVGVTDSQEKSPWTTVLLTARMVADLLRLDASDVDTTAVLPETTDLVAFDPISNVYDTLDADGDRDGSIPIGELARLPLSDVVPLVDVEADEAEERRTRLSAALELHLDLRTPLPRPRLLRRGRAAPPRRVVRAGEETVDVTGHALGTVRIRRRPGDGPVRMEIEAPLAGALPPIGTEVSIVVEEHGGDCTLILPDLSAVPAEFGRPRPATVLDRTLVRLEPPLDPDDVRDDVGETVRLAALRGPFPALRPGDVVLVTHLEKRRVQAVSTAITWPTAADARTASADGEDARS